MSYIGIDHSLTGTGLSCLSNNTITHCTISTKPKDYDNRWLRYDDLTKQIMLWIKKNKGKYITLEDYILNPKNPRTTMALIEAGSLLRTRLTLEKYQWITVAGSQLKKYILGRGSGDKSLIIKEVYKQYGLDINNNNEADAIVLAHMCRDIISNKQGKNKPQRDVLKKILKEREKINWI